MRRLYSLFLFVLAQVMMMAQTPSGRSAQVTLFADFKPVTVVLNNGKVNNLRYGNVFMKNSTLVYKQTEKSTVMEANMDVVKRITIDKRTFINVDRQLAEVVATVGENNVVRVRTIDIETMKAEMMNESNYTNFDMGEVFSFTKSDVFEKEEPYPLVDKYYLIIDGKKILAHERSVRNLLSRKRLDDYDAMIRSNFNWGRVGDLERLLRFLTDDGSKK